MFSTRLAEQAAYYRARASEYDEWWQRLGRHDHGEEFSAQWNEETREVECALTRFAPSGNVLELASGTGWWTERLARMATALTCVDAAPETIALNRERLARADLPLPTYVEADLFAWNPAERFDVVFFSFWLRHVPSDLFEPFWRTVANALKPEGRVFFIDSHPVAARTTQRNHATDAGDETEERRLNDGRTFRIVKIYHEPSAVADRLQRLGWRATCNATPRFFIYGEASLP